MHAVLEELGKVGIVPVIKIDDAEKAVPLARALAAGGIPCAEITFRTAQGEEAIRRISKEAPEMLVGAGTVLTCDQVDKAVNAGAKFIVSPGLNPKVVSYCIQKGIPVTPGCANPSDIEQALEFGLEVVKFFPAEQAGGIEYIKAVSAPYPNLKFIPTGGITAANIAKYISFNKVLACGGSWMATADLIKAGDFEKITALAREAVLVISGLRAARAKSGSGEGQTAVKTDNPARIAGKVVTLGEIMLRLAPQGYNRFVQEHNFGATFGGGEANVAVSLANFGIDAAFVTKLPKHEIGQAAVNSLRQFGVDTSKIVRGGSRVGIYFLEKGASQRPSKVIYDRANSAIAMAATADFDWNAIFDGVSWFHFTGITPAISDNAAAITLDAVKAAKAKNITVSCDLNYRKNLWSKEKAGEVMGRLMPFVDLCIANEEDAADVFGIRAKNSDVTSGSISNEGYREVAKTLMDNFKFKKVAITLRESVSANDNNWSAMYCCGEFYFSKKYAVHIVDRVGGGDSFAAGLIYANLKGFGPQECVEFAVAASCLKHSIEGDFNQVSVDEVLKLAAGDASGRVQR